MPGVLGRSAKCEVKLPSSRQALCTVPSVQPATNGRMGALAYHHLGKKAAGSGGPSRLDVDLKWALRWWKEHIVGAKPRIVRTGKRRRPVYIFTDGSCDPCDMSRFGLKAGYGAVMYDPEDGALELFGGQVSDDLMDILSDGGTKRQAVGQSELIPCHAAKKIWAERLKRRLVVLYVDNEVARYALIKGSSPTRDSA